MLTLAQQQKIIQDSQVELGNLSVQVSRQEAIGIPCRELVRKGYLITALIQAVQNNQCLSVVETNNLYEYLKQLSYN